MTHDDVLAVMRKEQGDMSLRQFALKLGFSAPYISDIYKKRRQIGRAVLRKFGLSKTVTVMVEYHPLRRSK